MSGDNVVEYAGGVSFGQCQVMVVRPKAILMSLPDYMPPLDPKTGRPADGHWFPRSVIHPECPMRLQVRGEVGEFVVADWYASKKGFV